LKEKGKGKAGTVPEHDYGIGTLIVRIVAAKNLSPATAPTFFFSGTANPYCVFDFEVRFLVLVPVLTSCEDSIPFLSRPWILLLLD